MLSKLIATAVVLVLLFYCLAVAGLYFFQERLIFPGKKLPDDYSFDFDLPFEEVTIPVDGAELNALHFQQENPRGVIFFLHGNGGNLVDWTVGVDFYQRINYDLFIFDYRGYGKSTGEISSQQQLMEDIRLAWQYMEAKYTDKPLVIYGRSLGTALATQLATEVQSDLLVLVSPFTSMIAMAKQKYPLVPTSLLRYPLRTDQIINRIKTDVIFIHGNQDSFITVQHSRDLQLLFDKPSELLIIEEADHNNIHEFESYLDGLAGVLPG